MKALTVRPLWAWLIINAGKNIENRFRPVKYRGPVLIQASAKRHSEDEEEQILDFARSLGIAIPVAQVRYGGSVGVVDIFDCTRDSASPWFAGCEIDGKTNFAWHLRDPRPVPFVKMSGQLSMYDVPQNVLEALEIR